MRMRQGGVKTQGKGCACNKGALKHKETYAITRVDLKHLAKVVALQVEGKQGERAIMEAVVLNSHVLGVCNNPRAIAAELVSLRIAGEHVHASLQCGKHNNKNLHPCQGRNTQSKHKTEFKTSKLSAILGLGGF